MSLFDRTFLISTGVTAVICGAIYYYLNAKIRDLEQALVKQNQVLSSFIANVQQEFRAMAGANGVGTNGVGTNGSGAGTGGANGMTFEIVENSNELASPEALAAVAELDNRKIVITESDCDSESEDDDSASEADASEDNDSASEADASEADASEADASEANITDNNKLIICDLSLNDMKIIDMSSLGLIHLDIYTPEKQSEDECASEVDASEVDASEVDASDSDSESDSEEDGFHRVTKLVIEDVNVNVLDMLNTTSKIEEVQFEELLTSVLLPVQLQEPLPATVPVPATVPAPVQVQVQVPAPVSVSKNIPKYDDLKVDELRKIVLEKGLAQKEEVKKLKKNELLALLKKNTLL